MLGDKSCLSLDLSPPRHPEASAPRSVSQAFAFSGANWVCCLSTGPEVSRPPLLIPQADGQVTPRLSSRRVLPAAPHHRPCDLRVTAVGGGWRVGREGEHGAWNPFISVVPERRLGTRGQCLGEGGGRVSSLTQGPAVGGDGGLWNARPLAVPSLCRLSFSSARGKTQSGCLCPGPCLTGLGGGGERASGGALPAPRPQRGPVTSRCPPAVMSEATTKDLSRQMAGPGLGGGGAGAPASLVEGQARSGSGSVSHWLAPLR